MQRISLKQTLSQKLSPQQIQFIKLLQVPTAELETRIEEELEANPALEEGEGDEIAADSENSESEKTEERDDEIGLEDYLHDEYSGYKMAGDGPNPDDENKQTPIVSGSSLLERLENQMGFRKLSEREQEIAKQIIGSIDADGYLRRELEAISNDLAFSKNIEAEYDELENLLYEVQKLDPPGIGARDLKECLVLQLKRKKSDPIRRKAIELLESSFNEFSKKHYEKIQKKLDVDAEELKEIIAEIIKLNPKPGGSSDAAQTRNEYIIPDFIIVNNDGDLEISLNSRNAPELRVSRSYSEMFQAYDKSPKKDKGMKQAVSFVKQKLDAAKWFIDAIKQRQETLMKTMNAIVQFQYDFFLEGDEGKLKPMILKDIAERINMDISTVSRVANSKAVQTEFGIYPLKFFFSEGIATDSGEDVSSREVKQMLKRFIEEEDKKKPLSDDKLEKLLKTKGYQIARRTVAKYREQLGIPVARLRKEL
ncbi:RNA polymerase factor sigma-54 [Hyphobacterium sp. CCMP332]|nr:RNA polymerase factor sigma-54 [Hyphobacterium sp. CCMP332]